MQMGTPVEIYERPANRFVADFIGESNFFDGRGQDIVRRRKRASTSRMGLRSCTGMPVSKGLVNGEECDRLDPP